MLMFGNLFIFGGYVSIMSSVAEDATIDILIINDSLQLN